MFGKKAGSVIVVTTKNELEKAMKDKAPCIEVKGSLEKKLKWMCKLKPAAVAALLPVLAASATSASLFAAPAVLPAAVAAAGIAAADISLCMLSASVLLAVLKNYNVEAGAGDKYIRLVKR